MKSMTIRNLPDPIYDGLATSAKAEHRSLQEQVRYILTNDVELRSRSVCEKAAEYRTKLAGRKTEKSVVADLREDRER
ncbi:MAG: plasmid stability protein [Candidatus Promineifilaceae bacterium]|jgi:plasmid stability protein